MGYTYLDDPAFKLWKEHRDVQAFEVRRRADSWVSWRRGKWQVEGQCTTADSSVLSS